MQLVAVVATQGWRQVSDLLIAFGLASVIGLEREFRQKAAGLRTHTLVGVGAALFMLVSKYGFFDVIETNRVVVDPSRVAAQIVSGIGFLGAGMILVRRGDVKGLTTAASIWLTAGVGAATGAGLTLLAAVTTGIYLFIAFTFPFVTHVVRQHAQDQSVLRVTYPDGQGILRRLLATATDRGFVIDEVATETDEEHANHNGTDGAHLVKLTLQVHGRTPVSDLATALSELPEVHAVVARNTDLPDFP